MSGMTIGLIMFAVLLMMLAVLLLCVFPGISTGLPDLVMGPESVR